MNQGVVLVMDDANEKLMQTLAEIIILKFHSIIKRGPQPKILKRLLVLDEAWRVSKSQLLVNLAREGRAFGVGMLVATQFPRDMPENLVSCLRYQLYLANKDQENQKIIVRALINKTSGPEAQQKMKSVQQLSPFQGYLIGENYKLGTRVDIVPYYERVN